MLIASSRARSSRARVALAALVPLFLAACSGGGGGGSTPPPPPPANSALVYGTAATGAGIAGTVSIEDAAGRVKSLPVAADSGAFSASVDGMTAPFMLKVASSDGTTVLYSAVQAPGRANITPLTSLALLRIAASRHMQGPSDLYGAPNVFANWITTDNLGAASATMLSRLMPAFVAGLPGASSTPDTAPTFDPFASTWTIGGTVDRLLDAYPVALYTDGTGVVTARQTDHASGLAIDVARSDTAAAAAGPVSITGAGQGNIVGGTSAQLGAQAAFQGGALQAVTASWTISGLAGASVDANGKVSTPAVDTAATVNVTAHWFDGSTASSDTVALTVLPALRPTGVDITGAANDAAVAAGASVPLGATVHWSDGSTTTPAVAWSFTGDAAAVAQLGSDGLLRTGRPASDSPIHVDVTFTHAGVKVSGDLALTVSRFVRRVQSVTLAGLIDGQVLTAGDHADLVLTALWNDGSESTLAPTWSAAAAVGATNHILASVSAAGRLSTSPYFVPTGADATARAAEADVLQANYDNGDGTQGQLRVNFGVKPLVNIPTGLEIRGVTAMNERDTASFEVFVDYADGSAALGDATLTSRQPALLAPAAPAGTFAVSTYESKPATAQVATLAATRSFTYVDTSGQSVTTTLEATHAVTISWAEPVLVGLEMSLDHLAVGAATPVAVTGHYVKFGVASTAPVANATFSVDSALVIATGNTLTAAQAPATAAASWFTLTATAHDAGTGADVTLRRLVTLDLPVSVPKHLLAYPWGPNDTDVQFRAISSDGHVDDYTVARAMPRLLGYESPATRRRLRLLSGVTDFAQARTDFNLATGAAQETQYVAAVEQGQVAIVRHDDLYAAASTATPVVLPGLANARQVAFVVRRDDGTLPPAAVRLYVLDQTGTVRQYKLPYAVTRPLVAADVTFERQLTGTFSQISAGADFILLLSTSGGAYSEGDNVSGSLGDPNGAAHWNDAFAVQYGVNCPGSCVFAPLTDVSQVHAGVDRSFVALSDGATDWGLIGPGLTLEWFSPTRTVGPAVDIRAMGAWAWLLGDGSVHFQDLAFAEDDAGGPGAINVGSTRVELVATWLPPVAEIADGRRSPAGTQWPFSQGETALLPMMPIVRTKIDTLYYLDGRAIRDPQGNAIVLP